MADFNVVKNNVTVEMVLERYGCQKQASGKAQSKWTSPLSYEKTASLCVTYKSDGMQIWSDFSGSRGGKVGGTVIDLVRYKEGIKPGQAARLLAEWYNLPIDDGPPAAAGNDDPLAAASNDDRPLKTKQGFVDKTEPPTEKPTAPPVTPIAAPKPTVSTIAPNPAISVTEADIQRLRNRCNRAYGNQLTMATRICRGGQPEDVIGFQLRIEPTGRPKYFVSFRLGENGKWQKGSPATPWALHFTKQDHDAKKVMVVEGEKTAAAAAKLLANKAGWAVCTPIGGSAHISNTDLSPLLKYKRIWLVRDNDEPGIKWQTTIMDMVVSLVPSGGCVPAFKVVSDYPSEFPKGWDLADPFPEGYKLPDLFAPIKSGTAPEAVIAPVVTPVAQPRNDATERTGSPTAAPTAPMARVDVDHVRDATKMMTTMETAQPSVVKLGYGRPLEGTARKLDVMVVDCSNAARTLDLTTGQGIYKCNQYDIVYTNGGLEDAMSHDFAELSGYQRIFVIRSNDDAGMQWQDKVIEAMHRDGRGHDFNRIYAVAGYPEEFKAGWNTNCQPPTGWTISDTDQPNVLIYNLMSRIWGKIDRIELASK